MASDTRLIHQDDICDCGAALDCWQGDFITDGYRYTKWVCQSSGIVVHDTTEEIDIEPRLQK